MTAAGRCSLIAGLALAACQTSRQQGPTPAEVVEALLAEVIRPAAGLAATRAQALGAATLLLEQEPTSDRHHRAPALASQVARTLDQAIAALQALDGSLEEAQRRQPGALLAALEACRAAEVLVKTQVMAVLAIPTLFRSIDGD